MTDVSPKPFSFDLELTQRCSLGCPHCYLGKPGMGGMSLATASDAMALLYRNIQSRRFGVRPEINFYGGEPFLNFQIVRHLVAINDFHYNMDVAWTIFTNGVTASPEQIEFCRAHGVAPQRSCAGCPEAAEMTRGRDYLDQWIEEGRVWGDMADAHRLVVTPAAAYLVCRSVRWMHLQGYYGPVDLATDDYAEWPENAWAAYEDQLNRLAREYVRQFKRGRVLGVENFHNFGHALFGQNELVMGCGACHASVGVDFQGRVWPCHRWYREENLALCAGQVSDILSSPEGWSFGPELDGIVSGWRRGEDRAECSSCPAASSCSRGCLHVNYKTCGIGHQNPNRCHATRVYDRLAREIHEELRGIDERWFDRKATPTTALLEE